MTFYEFIKLECFTSYRFPLMLSSVGALGSFGQPHIDVIERAHIDWMDTVQGPNKRVSEYQLFLK
jgi:hypothetical protein